MAIIKEEIIRGKKVWKFCGVTICEKIKHNEKIEFKICGIVMLKIIEKEKFNSKLPDNFLGETILPYEVDLINKFVPMMQKQNFKDDFLCLTKGLDKDSLRIVELIVSSLRIYKLFENIHFCEEERKDIEFVKEAQKEIIKFGDENFYFRGYFLPIPCFSANVIIFKHSINSIVDMEKIKAKDIIDVGGFIGDSALILSSYTDKKVYSFEALQVNFEAMKKTIELNRLTNVKLEKLALGSEPGEAKMPKCDLIASGLSIQINGDLPFENYETVPMETLDNYVEINNLSVGLIKVDIEGFEQEFLKGAEQTIKKQKPTLLISIYHNYNDFFKIKPLIESWDIGYTFKIVKPNDGGIVLETLLLAEFIEQI